MASQRSIYVSSTFADLEGHRAALKLALEKADYAVASMETYPAFEERPLDKCLADVARADGYVLLVAHRYGHRPKEGNPEGTSITQLEYEEACRLGKRPLVFTIEPDHPWPPRWMDRGEDEAALKAFRASVEKRHGVNRFTDPDQLAALVLSALSSQEGRSAQPGAAPSWTAEAIEAWVAAHREEVARQFLEIPAVQDRSLHVDLPVELRDASGVRKLLLQPSHLASALKGAGSHLILIAAEGGAGKTSLAFQIARWGLAGELAREPEGAPILPVLIDTALVEGETVLSRVRQRLEAASGAVRGGLEEGLVAELLRRKRVLVIIDHFSELGPQARERVVRSLPTGLVVITSRQAEQELLGDRASTRIQPLQIALDQLQRFFHEVLERKGVRERFSDDDLEPTQRQLRRMVGDKPITPLLALLFIDDVIAKMEGQGVLAASVPELVGTRPRAGSLGSSPPPPGRKPRRGLRGGGVRSPVMSSAVPPAESSPSLPACRFASGRWLQGLALASSALVLGLAASGCQRGPSAESQRLDRVDLKIQQLEQRLNKLSVRSEDGADKAGKPPAGVIKSLTLRMGSDDDRLRIYWSDGSKTDIPCTKEQSTFVCG